MALAEVQVAPKVDFSGTNTGATITFDSAPTEGNLILIWGGGNMIAASVTWPTGFTAVATWFQANPFQNVGWGFAWKIAGASEGTTYAVAWSSTYNIGQVGGMEISGADTTTPIDVVGTQQQQSFDNTPTVLGLTTVTDAAWHMLSFGHAIPQDVTATSGYTIPSGWATAVHVMPQYKEIATAGATGNLDLAIDAGTSGSGYTRGFAIRPATGGGGIPMPVAFHHHARNWRKG